LIQSGVRYPALWRRAFLCLLAFGIAGVAVAQDRRDALQALEHERALSWRQEQLTSQPLLGASGAAPWIAPLKGETPCFMIRQVQLVGAAEADLDRFAWLADDLGAFEQACLGSASIDILRRNLDSRLMARGYVTSSVTIPEQNLAQGTLQLRLHPGRLGAIDYLLGPGATRAPSRNALALVPGAPLNLRDIEQTLENLARLPSQAAQFQIAPGAGADQSLLQMAIGGGKRWRVGAGLDNAAARDFGQWQFSANAALDAPLALSDQLAVSLTRTVRNQDGTRHLASAMLNYSVPYRYHLFSVTGSRSTHARPVQGASTRFSEHGFDSNWQARWQWTPWRSAAARWSVWNAVSQRQARTYLEDVELVLQRRSTRQLEWGSTLWMRVARGGELRIDYDAARGKRVGLDPELGPDAPPLPRTAHLQLDWLHGFGANAAGQGWQYEARLSWQSVHQPASGADLPILGSRWTVRGFDARNFLSGQEMTLLHQDLRAPWRTVAGVQAQLFAGLDHGRIGAAGTQPGGTVLTGAALGLRAAGPHYGAEITLAHPLRQPHDFATDGWVAYLNFNFNY